MIPVEKETVFPVENGNNINFCPNFLNVFFSKLYNYFIPQLIPCQKKFGWGGIKNPTEIKRKMNCIWGEGVLAE